MDFSLTTGIVGALAGTSVLFLGLLYIRTLPGRPAGLDHWTAAFALSVLRYVAHLSTPIIGGQNATFIAEATQAWTAVLLLAGTLAFLGRPVPWRWLTPVLAGSALWSAYTSYLADDFLLRSIPLYALSGTALLTTALILWRSADDRSRAGYTITAFAFALWGVHKLDYPLLRPVEWFAPIGFMLAQVFAMAVALGLLIVALHRLRSDVVVAEQELRRSSEVQRVIGDLLRLSLTDVSLGAQLRQALGLVMGLGAMPPGTRAGIFLAKGDDIVMTPAAERDLPPAAIEGCALLPRGEPGGGADGGPPATTVPVDERHNLRVAPIDGHGATAVPILSGETVLGAVIAYTPDEQDADDSAHAALDAVAGTLAAMIERKRADEALRRSEERFREMTEVSSDWFWEMDRSYRFTHLSSGFAYHSGLDPERILGHSWTTWGRGLTDEEAWHRQLETMDARVPFRDFEYWFQTSGGDIQCWSISGKPVFDEQGAYNGYRGTARNVTREKRTQQALVEAKHQAEYANRTKSEFLANMSHELRTPLNAIIGFSETMMTGMLGPLPERYMAYTKDIHDSGRHLLSIINDILDISKVESGRFELRDDEVALVDAIEACHMIVRARAEDGGVTLAVDIAPDLPKVRADERAIKQIVLNLLSNAVKFTDAGGHVEVSAQRGDGGGIVIRVSDDGIGIAEADIDKAMAPFGQVESSLSRSSEGTGLGLPLVRSLAELHGGRLAIDSTRGAGTTATVFLPAERVLDAPDETRNSAAN